MFGKRPRKLSSSNLRRGGTIKKTITAAVLPCDIRPIIIQEEGSGSEGGDRILGIKPFKNYLSDDFYKTCVGHPSWVRLIYDVGAHSITESGEVSPLDKSGPGSFEAEKYVDTEALKRAFANIRPTSSSSSSSTRFKRVDRFYETPTSEEYPTPINSKQPLLKRVLRASKDEIYSERSTSSDTSQVPDLKQSLLKKVLRGSKKKIRRRR